jgi:hypothetical protein
MAVKPGPNAYPLTGYQSPDDVQSIMNQPAAVLLDGSPEAAAYVPPAETESPRPTGPGNRIPSPEPTEPPVAVQLPSFEQAAEELAAARAATAQAPVPFWKNPMYVGPAVAVLVVIVALWAMKFFSKPSKPAASAQPATFPRPSAPQVRYDYGDSATVWDR